MKRLIYAALTIAIAVHHDDPHVEQKYKIVLIDPRGSVRRTISW